MAEAQRIIASGWEHAYSASIGRVREEVRAEYAVALERAGAWRRLRIRIAIAREIRRRMEKIAPADGLY